MQALPLQPGDRILFLTDGMLERNAEGVDIAAVLTAGREMHPREAVQHLSQVILDATDGELKRRCHRAVLRLAWRALASENDQLRRRRSGAYVTTLLNLVKCQLCRCRPSG